MMRTELSLLVMNQPGVLVKVATIISGRGLNIHEMTARIDARPQHTRIVVDFLGEEDKVRQVGAQLDKLEVVREVDVLLDESVDPDAAL